MSSWVQSQANSLRVMNGRVVKRVKPRGSRIGTRGSFLYTEEGQEIPAGVKNVTIMVSNVPPKTFRGRHTLETVTFTEKVETIGAQSFENCTKIHRIQFHDSNKLRVIHSEAFYSCTSLTSIDDLPEGLQEIGSQVFQHCRKLRTVHFPSSLKKMGVDIFRGCSSLEVIEIPSGVKEVPHSAFFGCKDLTSVYLPSGLKVIGENAFFMCSSLSIIEIPNNVEQVGRTSFYDCKLLKEKASEGDIDMVELYQNRFNGLPLHRLLYYQRKVKNAKSVLDHYLSSKYRSRHQKGDAFHETDIFGMTAFDIIADLDGKNTVGLDAVATWFDNLPDIELKEEESIRIPVSSLDKLTEEEKHRTFGDLTMYVQQHDDSSGSNGSMSLEDKKAELISLVNKASFMIKELDEQISSSASSDDAPSMMSSSVDTDDSAEEYGDDEYVKNDDVEDEVAEDEIVEDDAVEGDEEVVDNEADIECEPLKTVQEEPEVEGKEGDPLNSNNHQFVTYEVGDRGDRELWTETSSPVKNKQPTQAKGVIIETTEDETEELEEKEEEKTTKKKKKKTVKSMTDKFGNFPLYGKLKTKKEPRKVVDGATNDENSSMAVLTDEDSMTPYKEAVKILKKKEKSKKTKKTTKFDPFGNYVTKKPSKARRSVFL